MNDSKQTFERIRVITAKALRPRNDGEIKLPMVVDYINMLSK